MPLKQIAKLQILAKHIEALVPPEPLQLGGVNAAVHPCGERAAFEIMAAKVVPPQAGRHGTRLTIFATVYGVIASLPIRAGE